VLHKTGCEHIYTDTLSGSVAQRPGLQECLKYLRAGDTIVVWKLDHLGRTLKHLIETVQVLKGRDIGFKSLQENIDTPPCGKFVLHVFHALAEFERGQVRRDGTKWGQSGATHATSRV
jgi:DNA invertase Pin-like site-specific DNA recombinase